MSEQINDIQQELAELKGRVDEISQSRNIPSRKNWIDFLSSLSPLISGVLIAAVGTVSTIVYNNRKIQINYLNALDKYRPYATSENPVERVFGYK